MINDSLLGGTGADTQMTELMRVITEALTRAGAGTKDWNDELWRHQEMSLLPTANP